MKVLISGYYGFANWGDEALLSGLLNVLNKQGHEPSVLSAKPQETRALHKVASAHRYLAFLPALLSCDAFISGGGGLLQDKTSRRSLQYYLGLIRLATYLGKKVIIYGQSIGPLSDPARKSLARVLRHCQIAVRDRASQTLLSQLGLSSSLIADAALLMPKREAVAKAGYVLLIPRYGYAEISGALSAVASALIERGQTVALSSVQASEDVHEIKEIMAAVPGLSYLPAHSPQQLLEIIQAADYVVSGRLHGLVLAALADVAYAGLVYDPKVQAFLEETGAASFGLPVATDQLIAAVIQKTAPDKQQIQLLKARAMAGADWLERVLST